MHRTLYWTPIALSLAFAPGAAFGQGFFSNPGSVYGLSADGRVAVGIGSDWGPRYGVAWFSDGSSIILNRPMDRRDGGTAQAIARNGRYIVGTQVTAASGLSGVCRWDLNERDPDHPEQPLAVLISPSNDLYGATARAVSDDGQRLAGTRYWRAVVWNGPDDMVFIGPEAGYSEACAISADGSRVAGTLWDNERAYAFTWTPAGGFRLLPSIDKASTRDAAAAMTADGLTIVGYSNGWLARWRIDPSSGEATPTPLAPGATWPEALCAINSDGSVIGATLNEEGVVWTDGAGVVRIADLAVPYGYNPDAPTLTSIAGISDDGLHLVGNDSGGQWWRLDLDPAPPCPPVVYRHPTEAVIFQGENCSLEAAARGLVTSCRWHRDGVPLDDDARVSGAHTTSLTITAFSPQDAGAYTAVFTSDCGDTESFAATVACRVPRTIHVSICGDNANTGDTADCGSPDGPMRNISAACIIASSYDTILVHPGTYRESLWITTSASIRSELGADQTIIDASIHPQSAISCLYCNPHVEGFTFTGGSGTWYGNNVRYGGGVFCVEAAPSFADCRFAANHAGIGGGYCGFSSSPIFTGCVFDGNSADIYGGAALNYNDSAATFDRCLFLRNSAAQGPGAVGDNGTSHSTLTNCLFYANTASYDAAFGNQGGHSYLAGCVFVGNTGAGTVYVSPTVPVIACTFTANVSTAGVPIVRADGTPVANTIIYANSGVPLSSNAQAAYCDIQGGFPGTGNIDAPPAFVRIPSRGADNMWGTPDDDYGSLQLRADSLCIDAASLAPLPPAYTTDAASNPRVAGAAPDIGAYERPAPACRADFNNDGAATSQDFFDFLGAFFQNAPGADFNADRAVNSQDFFDFLGAFFLGC
jgi:uncharacterized membrane protein